MYSKTKKTVLDEKMEKEQIQLFSIVKKSDIGLYKVLKLGSYKTKFSTR